MNPTSFSSPKNSLIRGRRSRRPVRRGQRRSVVRRTAPSRPPCRGTAADRRAGRPTVGTTRAAKSTPCGVRPRMTRTWAATAAWSCQERLGRAARRQPRPRRQPAPRARRSPPAVLAVAPGLSGSGVVGVAVLGIAHKDGDGRADRGARARVGRHLEPPRRWQRRTGRRLLPADPTVRTARAWPLANSDFPWHGSREGLKALMHAALRSARSASGPLFALPDAPHFALQGSKYADVDLSMGDDAVARSMADLCLQPAKALSRPAG